MGPVLAAGIARGAGAAPQGCWYNPADPSHVCVSPPGLQWVRRAQPRTALWVFRAGTHLVSQLDGIRKGKAHAGAGGTVSKILSQASPAHRPPFLLPARGPCVRVLMTGLACSKLVPSGCCHTELIPSRVPEPASSRLLFSGCFLSGSISWHRCRWSQQLPVL